MHLNMSSTLCKVSLSKTFSIIFSYLNHYLVQYAFRLFVCLKYVNLLWDDRILPIFSNMRLT